MAAHLHEGSRPSPLELYEALYVAKLTMVEAATLFGVSRQTVTTWKRKPEFVALCEQIAADLYADVRAQLRAAAASDTTLALTTLRGLCLDERQDHAGKPVTPAAAKVAAARELLGVHERVAPVVAPAAEDSAADESARALAAIREAKLAADARRAAQGAPVPVESNV